MTEVEIVALIGIGGTIVAALIGGVIGYLGIQKSIEKQIAANKDLKKLEIEESYKHQSIQFNDEIRKIKEINVINQLGEIPNSLYLISGTFLCAAIRNQQTNEDFVIFYSQEDMDLKFKEVERIINNYGSLDDMRLWNMAMFEYGLHSYYRLLASLYTLFYQIKTRISEEILCPKDIFICQIASNINNDTKDVIEILQDRIIPEIEKKQCKK